MANGGPNDWDEGAPLISDARRLGAGEILNLRKATRARINKEHDDCATGDVTLGLGGGEHSPGSAKCYYQSGAPTLRPDNATALDSNDAGRIWIDSDDGSKYYWSGSAWVAFVTSQQSFDLPGSPGAGETWSSALALPLTTPFATPLQVSGLNAGKWLVWIGGVFDGSQTGSITVVINGQTRTYVTGTTVDGQVPFLMCVRCTVTSANHYIRITSVSSIVQRIESITGQFVG